MGDTREPAGVPGPAPINPDIDTGHGHLVRQCQSSFEAGGTCK
jgi:hypothetical protein